VDVERDEMQNALDEKTEENIQLQNRIQSLIDELDRAQSKFIETQSKGDRGYETISALEERLRDIAFKG
jgi:peptidoglycan hydrolase CwlO-like protein